jgi:hypothetical protein
VLHEVWESVEQTVTPWGEDRLHVAAFLVKLLAKDLLVLDCDTQCEEFIQLVD